MKINLVRKRLTKKNLLKLIDQKSESYRHDYKLQLDLSNKREKYSIIKDIIAFSNNRGGYLIIGVSDNYDILGIKTKIDVSLFEDFLESFFGLPFDIESSHYKIDNKLLFFIFIPSSIEKILTVPKTVNITHDNKTQTILNKGDVFFRRGSRSRKATTHDYDFMIKKINYFKKKVTNLEKNMPENKSQRDIPGIVTLLSNYWSEYTKNEYVLNDNWRATLINFSNEFTVEELKQAIDITFSKSNINDIEQRFKYFCGIVHNWKRSKSDEKLNNFKRAKEYY